MLVTPEARTEADFRQHSRKPLLDPVIEHVVKNHHDPDASVRAGHRMFLFKGDPGKHNALTVVDTRGFAEWLKRVYQSQLTDLTVDQLANEIDQVAIAATAAPRSSGLGEYEGALRSGGVRLGEHDIDDRWAFILVILLLVLLAWVAH